MKYSITKCSFYLTDYSKLLDQNFLPNIISDIIAYIIFYRLDIVAVFSICHFVHYIHQVFSSFFEKWPKFLIELSHIFKAENTLWSTFLKNIVRKGGQVFVLCRLVQLPILTPTDINFSFWPSAFDLIVLKLFDFWW